MIAHTPGPYERRGNLLYTEDKGLPGEAAFLAECASKDDAAFIARACNSHEAMLEALKDLLDYAVDPAQFTRQNVVAFIDKGTEAIRLAEGSTRS